MKRKQLHVSGWIAVAYYALAFIVRPGVSCQFPFQTDDLWLFGFVPAAAGVIGILSSGRHDGRILSWVVFILGIAGIALAFIPWRNALWYGTP